MNWFGELFRKRSQEQNLDAELRFHLEQQIRDGVAGGLSLEEARRQALLDFGGLDQIKEQCRTVRPWQWLETTLQDVRYGLRSLARTPGFTALAVGTIALGIGANTAIFSFVDGVLLKPVPFPEGERLVRVVEKTPDGNRSLVSTLTYLDWAKLNTSLDNIFAASGESVTLTGTDTPSRLGGWRVSASYFDVFRIRPVLGRGFAKGEDQPGRDHVVVINNALWVSRFGSDPGVIGRTIMLDGEPNTVIGVLPPGVLDRKSFDLYRPLAFPPEKMTRDYHWLVAYALLKPGTTIAQARIQMDALGERIAHDYPKSNKGWGVAVVPFAEILVGADLRRSLYILASAVGMVLLIACGNLANLTLARGVAREREVAIRAALGASRWRLIRQFLTESLLLSCTGGGLGLLVGYGGIAALNKAPGFSLPTAVNIVMDGRVLLFTLGLSVLTGIVFGIAPAVGASRPNLTRAIKEGGPAVSDGQSLRSLRSTLVVVEVALAFMLLSSAGLLIRSLGQLRKVDTGFDPTNVITAYLPISDKRFASGAECNLYLAKVTDAIRALPGVREVASTVALPLQGWGNGMPFQVVGAKPIDLANRPTCFFKQVSPSYFHTLGIRLVQGRLLNRQDVPGSPPVAVISESMARRYFPNGEAVGKHILVQEIAYAKPQLGPEISWEVVGIARDEKVDGLDSENDDSPGIYVSTEQSPQNRQYLVVRGASDPSALGLGRAMRHAVQTINRDQVLDGMKTLDQIETDSLGDNRLRSSILSIFSGLALLLAGIGLYGVISYSTTQRTREIGIRAALGATSANILGLVMRNGMILAAIGLAIGIGGALVLSRFLATFLFGIGAYDPLTFGAAVAILFSTAILACYFPARKAIKVDPIVALKCD